VTLASVASVASVARLRRRALLLCAAGPLLVAPAAAAQGAPAAKPRFALQIKPRVGDTIVMRMEQRMDVTLAARSAHPDSAQPAQTMTTSTLVLSRAVVQEASERGATVLAITDSIAVTSNEPDLSAQYQQMGRALRGSRTRLYVSPEGATRLAAAPSSALEETQARFAQMPATLPSHPVAVGDTWTSSLPLPGDGTPPATFVATFRLDSLSRDGGVAYISTRGKLTRDVEGADAPSGMRLSITGTLVGSLVFHRKRGWLTESTFTVDTRSTATAKSPGAAPMRMQMKVTQTVRTVP
jgi:hypothetical protein